MLHASAFHVPGTVARASTTSPTRPWRFTLSEWPHPRSFVRFPVQEVAVKTMSYTESRANYAAVLGEVVNNR